MVSRTLSVLHTFARLLRLFPPPTAPHPPSHCPPLQPSRWETGSLGAPSAAFSGSASVFMAGSFFTLPAPGQRMNGTPVGCWNNVELLQGAALGQGLPSGLAEAVSELFFYRRRGLPTSSFPVPFPGCHVGTEFDSSPAHPAPSHVSPHIFLPSQSLLGLILSWRLLLREPNGSR